MLLRGQRLTLVGQLCQSAANAEASVAGFDYIVDVAKLCGLVRVGECLCVFVFLLSEERFHVAAFLLDLLGFLATEHGHGAACAHDGDFGCRPCEVEVGTKLPP